MEAKFVARGDVINHTPDSAVEAGDVVVIGTAVLGVATYPIAADATGALALEGVFDVAVADNEALAVGVPVYWDDTNKVVTATSVGNIPFGVTLEVVAEATEVGRVRKINYGAIAEEASGT